jgi:hypothetical protein
VQSKSPISTLNMKKLFSSIAKPVCFVYLETLTVAIDSYQQAKRDDKDCNVASDLAHSLDMCIPIYFWFLVKRLDHSLRWTAGGAISDAARADHSSGEVLHLCGLVFDTLQFWPCRTADCRTSTSVVCIRRSCTPLHPMSISISDYPEVVSLIRLFTNVRVQRERSIG